MANCYSQFSEMIENVTPEEAAWIETILRLDPLEGDDLERLVKELEIDGKTFDFDGWPNFEWSTKGEDKGSLWLYSEENYTEEHLIAFVQAFLKRFRPDYIFRMSGAGTCSRPRVGEFGGFWLVISANKVVGGSTWDAAHTAAEEMEAEPK